jgi:hypothetical protein
MDKDSRPPLPAAASVATNPARGTLPYEKPELRSLGVRSTSGKPVPTSIETTTFVGPGS